MDILKTLNSKTSFFYKQYYILKIVSIKHYHSPMKNIFENTVDMNHHTAALLTRYIATIPNIWQFFYVKESIKYQSIEKWNKFQEKFNEDLSWIKCSNGET